MSKAGKSSAAGKLAAAALLALSACATSDSNTYSNRDVGQVIESSRGRVISSRPVDIASSEQSNIGSVTGGVVGGIAGSTIGQGKGQSLAVAGGILLGTLAGYLIEQQLRGGQGTEYLVEMEDGRTVTIVQNETSGEAPIPDGQEVAIQYGADYTRLTPIDSSSTGSAYPQTASAGGYPSDYPPASGASGYPPADPSAAGYPPGDPSASGYPPADPASYPASGGASAPPPTGTGSAGAPIRPGDSEWRNPDLEQSSSAPVGDPNSAYDPDAAGAPIFVPGPSNAN